METYELGAGAHVVLESGIKQNLRQLVCFHRTEGKTAAQQNVFHVTSRGSQCAEILHGARRRSGLGPSQK
eukprot:s3440_g2.t1